MYIQHRSEAKEQMLDVKNDPEKGPNDEKNQNGIAVQPEQSQNSILGSQFLGIENAAFEMEKYKL